MKEQERGRELPAKPHAKSRTHPPPNPKDRADPSPSAGFDLQRTLGNQAVANLIQSGPVQGSLRLSEPGEADEVEADRVADQVVGGRVPDADSGTTQRRSNLSADERQSVPDAFLQSLGPGQPLDSGVRKSMESKFGQGFGDVKVHSDSEAASSARSMNARAYTAGHHIVFGDGQYSPRSNAGIRLLAHELAHTVQNRSSGTGAQRASGPTAAIKRDTLLGKASGFFEEKTAQAGKWLDEKKWAIYRAMIAGLKSDKAAGVALMRSLVPKLPAALQSAASTIIDVVDFLEDLMIGLLLAIIGLAVGFVEGIVGLIVGIIKLALGLIRMVIDAIVAVMGKPDEFNKDLDNLAAAVKGIPPGLIKIKDQWLERYKRASLEEQALMGGELVGQIEAFLATFAFAGAKGGQATTFSVRTGEVATKVAARTGLGVLEPAPAVAITIPAVIPKTAAEAAVVSSQMMMSSSGPTAAGMAGGSGGSGRSSKPKGPQPEEEEGAGNQPSKAAAKGGEESRLQQKYGGRSKTPYPANEWRRIEQLEDRFPKLKDAKLRPVRRPTTGGEALFEERMQTTQSNYGLAGYSSDGQQVIPLDGISPDGFVEEIKIQQAAGSIDDIMAQLRRQADFAKAYGLRGVEYSVQPPAMADAVEARVAEERLSNVYRAP